MRQLVSEGAEEKGVQITHLIPFPFAVTTGATRLAGLAGAGQTHAGATQAAH